jgi:phosphoglycerate dehydrogenase-like enzyme
MNNADKVAVCSRSFSRNPTLRAELLGRYSNVTFNDGGLALAGDGLVEFLRGHDKAIVALEQIDDSLLSEVPELKVIGKYGVGVDSIDVDAMRKRGLRLGWIGGVNRRSVAELTLAFAITMLRHLPAAHREVLSGTWRQHLGGLLTGRTFGIIGCGRVGKDLVRLLQPFECPILVNDIRDYPDFYSEFDIETTVLDDLLSRCDIVSLHVPLDHSTRGMISADRLALMSSSAILINSARGGIVDEEALKFALAEGRLAGAAFDVFAIEPPQDRELITLSNFLATPHIGGSSEEAILAMGRAAITGLDNNRIPDEFWPG